MLAPSTLITIEFGAYGNRTAGCIGDPEVCVVKSTGEMYCESVLPIYSTVLLVPGVVMLIGFEITGLPFPNRPS